MTLGQRSSAVGIFSNQQAVEHVLNELNSTGFLREQISVVANTDRNDQLEENSMSEHIRFDAQAGTTRVGAIVGSLLGALGGCLIGVSSLAIPGVGPIAAIATSGTAVAGTLAGAGIGLVSGSLIALAGSSRSRVYDARRFSQAEYLVMVYGADEEMHRAESILGKS